jgi:hypothetical protein
MQEHGSFELKVKNKTLISTLFGAWNYETTIRYSKECKQLVDNLTDEPWGSLVDFTEWELATPDILEVVDELNAWASINNLKYEVVICSLSLQQQLMEQYQESLTSVETKFVKNLEQAYEWLKSMGVLKI